MKVVANEGPRGPYPIIDVARKYLKEFSKCYVIVYVLSVKKKQIQQMKYDWNTAFLVVPSFF